MAIGMAAEVLSHVLLTAAPDPLSCWMPGHVVGWVVCTGLIFDDHLIPLDGDEIPSARSEVVVSASSKCAQVVCDR